MVNRSKPTAAVRKMNENMSNISEENSIIRLKNMELAKGLADYRQKYRQLFQDNMTLRKKLLDVETQNMKLIEAIKRIESYGRFGLSKVVSFSEDLTHMLQETAQFTYTVTDQSETEGAIAQRKKSENRRRAVKPMVSGHTIGRPTITLQRVTTEQLEQLRNSTVAHDGANAGGNNSITNGYPDDLSTSDRTSPLSDEQANDNNDEEEELNGDDINEQSEAPLPNIDRMSTLREETNENISEINDSRLANDTRNSERSASFREITNYTTKVFPRSSRNSSELTGNPQVILRQLSPDMLRNVPVSLNKENVYGSNLNISETYSKSPTRFLHLPARSFKQKRTNREVSTYEMCGDATNNASIFNEVTVENSFTKFRENNDDDALEETLNVSTLVNVSFETGRLSDNLDYFMNCTDSNTVDNVIERPERFTKLNEENQSRASEDNCNIKSNNNSDTSCFGRLSKIDNFGDKPENGTSVLTQAERKRHSGDTSSYNPLEGPSTLLDNTSLEERISLHGSKSSPFKNTSTPYSPTMITFRRRHAAPLSSPQLPETTTLKETNTQDELSPISSLKVGKRRKKVRPVSSINIKSEGLSLSHFTNCSVNVTKLPRNLLAEKIENASSEVATNENLSKRTSFKRKSSPSKKKKIEKKKRSSPVKLSPKNRRTRKAYVPGAFKEPSLAKKLRRSK